MADSGYSLEPSLNDEDLVVAQAIEIASTTERTALTSAAEKWLAGITALYGLFGLTGIAVGKDSVAALDSMARYVLIGIVSVGVAAAGCATVNGYLAAYGWPRTIKLDTDEERRTWYEGRRKYPFVIAKRLRRAVFSATVALAALLAATALVWFGSPAPSPLIDAKTKDGSKVCGELIDSNDSGVFVVLRADNGDAVDLALGDITSITTTSSC